MKVVIDTNVIVSALLNSYGHPAEIIRLLLSGKIDLYYDQRILSEYEEVLNRPKFQFNPENIKTFLNEIKLIGTIVLTIPLKKSLPDIDDNMFLEVALSANVKYIITGNIKHFPKSLCENVMVVAPANFINEYLEKS